MNDAPNSPSDIARQNIAATVMGPFIKGILTLVSLARGPIPRTLAASSYSLSMDLRPVSMMRMAKGVVSITWAKAGKGQNWENAVGSSLVTPSVTPSPIIAALKAKGAIVAKSSASDILLFVLSRL